MTSDELSLLIPPRMAVTRYITPLREGGSLPALVEADDRYKYVLKFRGAGHGAKALIAEFIGSWLAAAAGLRVPQLALLDVDEDFGRTEGDEEIQDLLQASRGLNLGMAFLSGALTYDVAVNRPDSREASAIVWLDAFLTNIDRTARNTNMLVWNGGQIWLIDHGASLYFHHSWNGWEKAALSPFPYVKDHALLPHASRLLEADAVMHRRITPQIIDTVVDLIPDEWLAQAEHDIPADGQRQVYRSFLRTRLENSQIFVDHAIKARQLSL
ncbi:MAG: aminotransferase class I and II [Bacteroidales bacterium]|nr:aminotransferase class I and II [Bacteroidales bacterium]